MLNHFNIFNKRRRGLPLESEAKKRLRLQEIKDYEGGKKCLSPSIFKRTKGPLIVGTNHSSATTSTSSETTAKSTQSGGKRGEAAATLKEFNKADFDSN
jgi:hypothetical protein